MDADNELKARAAARIGHVLRGKYRVDSVLGIGGMAVVYAATHRNKKRFALKILHPELSMRSDIRQRFLREGYAANSLGHPGAVAILDEDIAEDGAAFLVMELLEGASTEALWEASGRRLPASVVLVIAHELLDLLAVAHEMSIVHRDIKPANLFVARDGALKVLDFGIARVKDVSAEASTTNTGTMLGTPAFMAPEQAGGLSSEIDGRTDLWGTGATLFTLLSGEHVHRGETPTQMAIQAATQPARSLSSVLPEAPAPIVALVDRALSFAKADRWDGARAMRDAVLAAEQALFGGPVSREALVTLVGEHARKAKALEATAPTVREGSDAELAPTLPQQSTPAFTPVSPLARSSATTGGHVAEGRSVSVPPSAAATRRSRTWLGVALGLAGVATAGGLALRSRQAPTELARPSATSPTTAPPVAAPAESPGAPSPAPVRLGVSPADAVVEIDGKPATVSAGAVSIVGSPGSMHLVHVTAGGHDGTYPVLVTDTGTVPATVELSATPAPALATAHRPGAKPTAAAPGPSRAVTAAPPATASQSPVSRTME
jgi:eukaryotic-like serine/threonine-protein kinase